MEKQQNTEQNEAPNIHSEHIKEEFYKWFESRGLLSDLRAYMRQLMVKALEESNKNGKTLRQRKHLISPKLQAINLIVVDYLFHEDYLNTVSVFASEAQFLDSLPQYSEYITQTVRERRCDPSSMPRFSQMEAEDILDTLRMPSTLRERQETTNMYLTGNDSLLTCVIRSFANSVAEPPVDEWRADEEECSHQLWSEQMQSLLLLAGVKLQHIRRMQHRWAQIIKEEKENAKKESEEELLTKQAETEQRIRTELEEQMRGEQEILVERQSRVELRERGLASLAEQLTAVTEDINERLSQVQLQTEELRVREARQQSDRVQLDQRFSQLQVREQQLHMLYYNFQEENGGATKKLEESHCLPQENIDLTSGCDKPGCQIADASVQTDVEEPAGVSISTQTPELVMAACTQTVNTVNTEQQTSQANQADPQLILQLQADRDRINELQEENLELRAHALQQRQRINELTNRAANLSSQLEESQIAITVLSGRDSAVVSAPSSLGVWGTRPPPPPTIITPTFGFNTPQRSGAGEENLFAARPQQTTPRQDARRRSTRFAFSQNPSPTSEESSPTDEAIQNARTRIQQLEQESAAVQRNFQDFQNRLLLTDSAIFPPLGALRNRNPIIRVRRSDVLPFTPYPSFLTNNQNIRPVQTQAPVEHEESSSDQAGFYDQNRIDSMMNARKLFTQRNMRQFDRWKQFKKKFNRHDADHSRKNHSSVVNYTSSEDDESELRRHRKRRELGKAKKSNDTLAPNLLQDKLKDLKCKDNKKSQESHVTFVDSRTLVVGTVENNIPITTISPQPDADKSACSSKPKPDSSVVSKTTDYNSLRLDQNKLKLEVERTEKLIESVKVLLADQNKNNKNSTLSSGSLQLDSLPRDSQNNSFLDVHNTDNSSVLTVQRVIPPIVEESQEMITTKPNTTKPIPSSSRNNTLTSLKPNQEHPIENKYSDLSNKEFDISVDDEKVLDVEDNNPEPLSIPTLRLVSPGMQHVESEDFIATGAIHAVDVAEQESGDRGTTSVTSGSDILRELNPSKTESSSSLVSGGWAEESKHSSDFWN